MSYKLKTLIVFDTNSLRKVDSGEVIYSSFSFGKPYEVIDVLFQDETVWLTQEQMAQLIDYNSKSEESLLFFKMVQNKLHYAVNQLTAAEVIFNRVDAEKEFLGLTSFTGSLSVKKDISIAKNYLNNDELLRLNRLVSAFFDLAELKALKHIPMKMKDWLLNSNVFLLSKLRS